MLLAGVLLTVVPLTGVLGLRSPFPGPLSTGSQERQTRSPLATNGTVPQAPLDTVYTFDQLIDHNDSTKGTFKQRYWVDWEFYNQGGPIVLSTPGESNAQAVLPNWLMNASIMGQIAQQEQGATVVLEHRFFGESNPGRKLTVDSLQMLTLEQSIDDLEYFAKNVQLPFANGENLAPGKAPWVLVGGSYSGALTAWTMVKKPGLFQAAWGSSATVETMVDGWQYFDPIRKFMPANCSADMQAVVAYFDDISTNSTALEAFKAQFGLQDVEHVDDVAYTLTTLLFDWQSLQPSAKPGHPFWEMCDALEVDNGVSAGEEGWGLEHALEAWGSWYKNYWLPLECFSGDYNQCFGSYNATSEAYTDISLGNDGRSWQWLVCHQFGWFFAGAPSDQPTIVSRTIQPSNRGLRQCQLTFPEAFPEPPSTAPILATNQIYGGRDLDVPNMFFANGRRDPWVAATLSADGQVPPHIPQDHIGVHDSVHIVDLLTANNVDPTVLAVQNQGLALMKEFLASWSPSTDSA